MLLMNAEYLTVWGFTVECVNMYNWINEKQGVLIKNVLARQTPALSKAKERRDQEKQD